MCNKVVANSTPPPKQSRLEKMVPCFCVPSLFLNHLPTNIGIKLRIIEKSPRRTMTNIFVPCKSIASGNAAEFF